MTPDARRRIAGALMAEQYNRPTPQDTEVVERGGLLPVGTYANGMSGPALPGFITQPFESFKRLVDQGYESGNPQGAEDAFNVAGAAMVGGLAAPRPRGSVGMGGRPEGAESFVAQGYHGTNKPHSFERSPWISSDPKVANTYTEARRRQMDPTPVDGSMVYPAEVRFQNPMVYDAKGRLWSDLSAVNDLDADMLAIAAKRKGHDGLVLQNVIDDYRAEGSTPATSYKPLQPGTVYSPLTGELLYANGGRQGAATGAAANAAAERQGIRSIDQLGRSDPHPGPVIGYHGTTASFDTFDPAKMQDPLGPFFGTSSMAEKFAQPNYARPSQGEPRVIPAQISSNKALDIAEDPSVIGTGRDTYIQPRDLVSSLEGAGLKPLDDPAVKQAFERTSVGNDFKSFRDRMGAERFGMEETSHHTADRIRFDALKDFMARNGYDTIRRWNEAGNGWEYAPVVRGIVQSPETGATLYSGGRPGAAVGAVSTADIVRALMQEDDATKYRGAI